MPFFLNNPKAFKYSLPLFVLLSNKAAAIISAAQITTETIVVLEITATVVVVLELA
jgi:hypothetical protein